MFKYKASLISNTGNTGRKKGLKIAVPIKYLSNFWRSLEMPLINCEVKHSLTWNKNCVLVAADASSNGTFKITNAKRYVPVATLSTEDSVKLLNQLNEGFKRSAYWNKYIVIDNVIVEIADAGAEKPIK